MWATNRAGDIAVTVEVDLAAVDRGPKLALPLTAGGSDITILRGVDLHRNFCTDVLTQESMPTSEAAAAAGHGNITVTHPPPPGAPACAIGSARAHLDGVVADDGTAFSPIDITSDHIGCYSG